jgi:hypothetical protein
MKKKILLQFKIQVYFLDFPRKLFGKWLTYHKLMVITHLPDKDKLIDWVFKNCVILMFLIKQITLVFPLKNNWTTFLDKLIDWVFKNCVILMFLIKQITLVFPLKNNWTTFLDKLNTSNINKQNTLHIYFHLVLYNV